MKESMKYCSTCAKPLLWHIPQGDNQYRHACNHCDIVYYNNPKIIVGTLPVWQGAQVLLCRRGIPPKHGFWTLPAGFMENGESTQKGAIRETEEEANAKIKIQCLHTIYDIPHIGQVYLLFLAQLQNLDFFPGEETLDLRLFKKADIKWDEIAFSPIIYCLQNFFDNDPQNIDTDKLPYHGCHEES